MRKRSSENGVTTPEQLLGNMLLLGLRLQQHGVRLNRKAQAFGSAAVDTLARSGWVIVRHDAVETAYKRGRTDATQEWIAKLRSTKG